MTGPKPGRTVARRALLHRLPLRGRLTLVTTVVFLILGSGLVLLNWLSAQQLIEDNRYLVVPAVQTVPVQPVDPAVPNTTAAPLPADPALPDTGVAQAPLTPTEGFEDFQDQVLKQVLTRSVLLLLVFTALAALLAWWAARRSLHRLTQVTAATRRISTGSSLDERLDLTGPHDEVRELGDTFDAMLDRLDRSFDAQRQFTAHASHELRTPLTLQRTALEIPLAQGRVPDDLRPAFRSALDANARTERLIVSLLTLARGESGTRTSHPVDLADAARDAVTELAEEARAAKIRITTTLAPAPVVGDPALLAQVAVNLLANAVRHNHPGGTATITTVTLGGRAFLKATNSGPVLEQRDIPALFEPFHRGHGRPGNGLGLGLAVVRAITLSHGGTITATPRPGGGITVRVDLPHRVRDAASTVDSDL
ncbi:HAMP domain-containing sensor histidine kinase [Streptomyces sp. BE147]|uniref:sensor histidine kinase n=1 Tax=unclassified Streptomyces TaxID=2593676 RepID=UPI002E768278|nr:HAMP domain-containing sensor histidine kinase [Streptomyces sp. BE147]MEE1736219.1 HAMP domain-containing sensor histidine kinase [Streptomyces sp. BE147]